MLFLRLPVLHLFVSQSARRWDPIPFNKHFKQLVDSHEGFERHQEIFKEHWIYITSGQRAIQGKLDIRGSTCMVVRSETFHKGGTCSSSNFSGWFNTDLGLNVCWSKIPSDRICVHMVDIVLWRFAPQYLEQLSGPLW